MNPFTQWARIGTVFALGAILVMANTAIDSSLLEAQQEEECIESLGPCVDLRYHYEHVCEGSICYTALEMCCLEDIVVR